MSSLVSNIHIAYVSHAFYLFCVFFSLFFSFRLCLSILLLWCFTLPAHLWPEKSKITFKRGFNTRKNKTKRSDSCRRRPFTTWRLVRTYILQLLIFIVIIDVLHLYSYSYSYRRIVFFTRTIFRVHSFYLHRYQCASNDLRCFNRECAPFHLASVYSIFGMC